MPKSDYIDPNDDAFAAQLVTFKNNIGTYAAPLGVTAAQMTAQAADAAYFGYVLACLDGMQNGAQQWTAWKNLVRGGGDAPASGAAALPTFPASVAAVALGVEVRFRALVRQIKASAGYNEAIGEALGIEGAVQSAPDMAALQPVITATVSGGRVEVGWGWQGHSRFLDMIELQVDRADGKGFVLLAYDSTPDYVDTAAFPATPTKWTYRAIYREGDAQVGQWSSPVSLLVG